MLNISGLDYPLSSVSILQLATIEALCTGYKGLDLLQVCRGITALSMIRRCGAEHCPEPQGGHQGLPGALSRQYHHPEPLAGPCLSVRHALSTSLRRSRRMAATGIACSTTPTTSGRAPRRDRAASGCGTQGRILSQTWWGWQWSRVASHTTTPQLSWALSPPRLALHGLFVASHPASGA